MRRKSKSIIFVEDLIDNSKPLHWFIGVALLTWVSVVGWSNLLSQDHTGYVFVSCLILVVATILITMGLILAIMHLIGKKLNTYDAKDLRKRVAQELSLQKVDSEYYPFPDEFEKEIARALLKGDVEKKVAPICLDISLEMFVFPLKIYYKCENSNLKYEGNVTINHGYNYRGIMVHFENGINPKILINMFGLEDEIGSV